MGGPKTPPPAQELLPGCPCAAPEVMGKPLEVPAVPATYRFPAESIAVAPPTGRFSWEIDPVNGWAWSAKVKRRSGAKCHGGVAGEGSRPRGAPEKRVTGKETSSMRGRS